MTCLECGRIAWDLVFLTSALVLSVHRSLYISRLQPLTHPALDMLFPSSDTPDQTN